MQLETLDALRNKTRLRHQGSVARRPRASIVPGTIEGNDVMLLGQRARERDHHVVERRQCAVQEDGISTRASFGIAKPMVTDLEYRSPETFDVQMPWTASASTRSTPSLSCRR
jgi:hypothetical protein